LSSTLVGFPKDVAFKLEVGKFRRQYFCSLRFRPAGGCRELPQRRASFDNGFEASSAAKDGFICWAEASIRTAKAHSAEFGPFLRLVKVQVR